MSGTSVVNLRVDAYDEYIGRGSPHGNPFVIGRDGNRASVLAKYRIHLDEHPELVEQARKELTGRVLGCFCKPKACHGDILIEFMERT